MAKKSKSMIGHDPLAWLKEDAEEAVIIEVEEKPESKVKAKKKTAAKSSAKTKAAKNKANADEIVFEIQDVQDISSVAGVYEEMKVLLKNKKVILDGEKVERIDTASLQLFYSFVQQAKMNSVEVVWRSPSDAIKNSARLLGMEDALQLNNAA
ncbi:MAG: STAS domain-containing protein [Gammaproteobacteria bacterium]|nr:STAS domain-containing protein [Gammaproteobacteria bacterium]MCW8987113.1 STAS domain-containing protein [Gammaproteobacteria bacterium]MCW9030012.1 STAS domain-containing protein [Gammaproteobacteria bacterium]